MTKNAERIITGSFPKLAAPAQRALAGAGYSHLEQLTKVKESELGKLHGMGPNALKTLRQALTDKGLSFATDNHTSASTTTTTDFPNIGKVARRELANAGYTYLEQLPSVSEAELLKIHGVGPKATRILGEALAEMGLSFAPKKK